MSKFIQTQNMELLPEWAEKASGSYFETNAILPTKDGRRVGNAVVVETVEHEQLGVLAVIKTDFGNFLKLTENELKELFYKPIFINKEKYDAGYSTEDDIPF